MTKTQALKLVEITSQRQADNGTVCYFDPITKCTYMSYESGYVRRAYQTRNWRGNLITTIYQVNKTRQTTYRERILIPTYEDRLDLICRAAVNYRKSLKKYTNA